VLDDPIDNATPAHCLQILIQNKLFSGRHSSCIPV
jgi:hypothetical protein